MPLFKYTVKNFKGETLEEVVEASDEKSLVADLRTRGLIILSIEEQKVKQKKERLSSRRVKPEEIALFSRQMATLVGSGLPLLQALTTVAEQVEHPVFQKVLSSVSTDIEQGKSLSESLSQFPQTFSNLFVNMVKAGEASGMLDSIMHRLACYLEASVALKKKVKSAMMYPIIVISLSIAITLVLIIKVIPVFAGMYSDFGGTLPLPTRMLVALSDFMREWLFLEFVGSVSAVILFRNFIKTEKGKRLFDRFKFWVPIFGTLAKKVAVARFAQTLSVLLKSGVSIVNCLEIVGATSGNWVIEKAISDSIIRIKAGESIAGPLKDSNVFPPMVLKMIAVGEKTGNLEAMLEKISDFYNEQVNTAVEGLTSLIEPLLIVFLGLVIGGIVICMFLPILQMSSMIS